MMIPCIGLASGLGAGNKGCGEGPLVLKEQLSNLDWKGLVLPTMPSSEITNCIAHYNQKLAHLSFSSAQEGSFFVSIGGDHSCGIGVWSGVSSAIQEKGDLGLIWIDAHMDSHTPETSESGNIHGMPLAVLLGKGDERLTSIGGSFPKVRPENVVLIGIRSFETGEAALLKELNIRIFYMEEIFEKGLEAVFKEALEIVSRNTFGYGISFDLDSIDPATVSAVGTPVDGGIDPEEFFQSLSIFQQYPPLAFELVEYIPSLDSKFQSLNFIQQLLSHQLFSCSIKSRETSMDPI
jgi:arginase